MNYTPFCSYLVKIRRENDTNSYCMTCFHRSICGHIARHQTDKITARIEAGHSLIQGPLNPVQCYGCGENLLKRQALSKCLLCHQKYNDFYVTNLLQDTYIDNAHFIYDINRDEVLYFSNPEEPYSVPSTSTNS